jgi:hypothetical protein
MRYYDYSSSRLLGELCNWILRREYHFSDLCYGFLRMNNTGTICTTGNSTLYCIGLLVLRSNSCFVLLSGGLGLSYLVAGTLVLVYNLVQLLAV